jgi:hypothetical protein
LKNKIIFSFLLVSFLGLLIPPGPAFAESPIPDSEPQCLPFYNIAGIDYELEFEEFIKNFSDEGEWKQIRCSYEAPDDAILPTGTPFSAVFNAIYTDTSMKNPNDLCDRSELVSESVALTFFYDNLSAQIWSTDHVAYWKVSRADIEAQAYNQLDVIANFADTCWEEIEKEFEVFDEEHELECIPIDTSRANETVATVMEHTDTLLIKRYGQTEWEKSTGTGDRVQIGDELKTIDRGRARIQFDDRFDDENSGPSIINMGRETSICIAEYVQRLENDGATGVMEFFKGQIRVFLKNWGRTSYLEVKTGTSVCGIRGTDFVISYDPDLNKVSYHLNDGKLEITETTTGETITLTAGQTLEISNGQIQPVSTLTSTVWDSLVEETGGVITVIPDWVKNNAGWWADDMIGDSDFAQGIQFLISEGIMSIPETAQAENTGDTQGIPSWVKNNAGWWADGAITDDDFVKGIQYLVGQGIIEV